MPNYKLTIQYEGTRYKGWQEQKHTEATIQGKLQRVLERMTEEEIDLQGSGRTDAGVHAKGRRTFSYKGSVGCRADQKYMNEYLPEDIAILQIEQVDGRFHSRLNAKSKTYEYRIYKGSKPDVFERRYVWPMEEKLDVAKMREAAGHLTGTHDFMAFCGNRRMKKQLSERFIR